jgi:hypothetical protein
LTVGYHNIKALVAPSPFDTIPVWLHITLALLAVIAFSAAVISSFRAGARLSR